MTSPLLTPSASKPAGHQLQVARRRDRAAAGRPQLPLHGERVRLRGAHALRGQAAATSAVQNAQRRASSGMSDRHSGHGCVDAVDRLGSGFSRAISALSGRTTKKNITAAMIRNDSSALKNAP